MDFVDWCGFVLGKLIEEGRNPHIDEIRLAQILYGEETRMKSEFWDSSLRSGMLNAVQELAKVGLVELDGNFFKVTVAGRAFARNPIPLWQEICKTELDLEEERILRVFGKSFLRIFR